MVVFDIIVYNKTVFFYLRSSTVISGLDNSEEAVPKVSLELPSTLEGSRNSKY